MPEVTQTTAPQGTVSLSYDAAGNRGSVSRGTGYTISGPTGKVAFAPNPLKTPVGQLVTWTNKTNNQHQLAVGGTAVTQPMGPGDASTPPYAVDTR